MRLTELPDEITVSVPSLRDLVASIASKSNRSQGADTVISSARHSGARPVSYAVSTAKSISMAMVTMSKSTCSVFGRMPLRSGRKACVAAYMVR